jgi:hypothetical protein
MKGARLTINILLAIALIAITIMVGWNLYPSWSEYARSYQEQLLFITLTSIMSIFFIRADNFSKKLKVLFRWPVRANVRQVNKWTAFMFMGVICTPVTIGVSWVEIAHYVFTVAGIVFAYLDILNFYRTSTPKILGWIGFGIAVLGMVGGKFLGLWTLGAGEFMAAIPIAIHVTITNNVKK